MMKHFLPTRLSFGLALGLLCFCLASPPAGAVSWGQRAPAFTLMDVSGHPTVLNELLGQNQAVVLALGTTWSYQFPKWAQRLKRLANRYKGGGVAVAAVFLRDKPQKVRLFANRHGLTDGSMLLLVDTNGSLIQPYGLHEIPRILLLDRAGTIHYDGPVDNIDDSLGRLLGSEPLAAPGSAPSFTDTDSAQVN